LNKEKWQDMDNQAHVSESRRKFLERAGRFAVYTPPAMMILMTPSAEAIAKSGCNNGVGNGPDCLPPGCRRAPLKPHRLALKPVTGAGIPIGKLRFATPNSL